jgi:hypothetical protein
MQSDSLAAEAINTHSGVSWAAIAAGAVGAAALSLLLIAFGAGIGFSAISPWSDSGVSAASFQIGTGIYLVIISVMSSAIGGYLAGRLRTKAVGLHTNEVFFRDTAHGFLAWAFATLISATVLTSAIGYLANGATAAVGGAAQSAHAVNPSEIYVDKLLRTAPSPQATANPAAPAPASESATPANPNQPATGGAAGASNAGMTNAGRTRAELLRLWTADFHSDRDLTASDRTYVTQIVAARTGLSQADAEKRVNAVVTEAKTAADEARKAAAHLSFWLTAAMLFGAFAASLTAAEGGALRDGTWNDRVLTPRTI